MPSIPVKRWLTVQQAADYMSVAVYTIRDAAWKGEIPHVRAGKRFLYDQQDLDHWAERKKERFGLVAAEI